VTSHAETAANVEDDTGGVRMQFGWCIARPAAQRAELAISEAMTAMIEAAVDALDCISAVVTAQGRALTLAASVLPYESLARGAGRADDAKWLRRHVRSPGWQVLVPRARASALAKEAPEGVTLQRVRSGVLVRAEAPTPFAMTATEELETWLLPVL
jgi:hypothetical protein